MIPRTRTRRASAGMSTVAACVLALGGTATLAGGVAVYNHGMIRIHVAEKKPGGQRVNLMIPGVVVPLAMRLVPEKELLKAEARARQALPAVAAALEELERYPDTVFVEVKKQREHVRVATRRGNLWVTVDSPQEDVRISLPLEALRSAVEAIAARGPVQ